MRLFLQMLVNTHLTAQADRLRPKPEAKRSEAKPSSHFAEPRRDFLRAESSFLPQAADRARGDGGGCGGAAEAEERALRRRRHQQARGPKRGVSGSITCLMSAIGSYLRLELLASLVSSPTKGSIPLPTEWAAIRAAARQRKRLETSASNGSSGVRRGRFHRWGPRYGVRCRRFHQELNGVLRVRCGPRHGMQHGRFHRRVPPVGVAIWGAVREVLQRCRDTGCGAGGSEVVACRTGFTISVAIRGVGAGAVPLGSHGRFHRRWWGGSIRGGARHAGSVSLHGGGSRYGVRGSTSGCGACGGVGTRSMRQSRYGCGMGCGRGSAGRGQKCSCHWSGDGFLGSRVDLVR